MSSAPDPWSINYFDPPNPHVDAPAPRSRTPNPVPEIEDLFRVQRDILKVLQDLEDLHHHMKGEEDRHVSAILHRLQRDVENTYKVINTYLKRQTQGTF